MFHPGDSRYNRRSQFAIAILGALSLMGLIVTAWIQRDFRREQEIVEHLSGHLPGSDRAEVSELAGGLRMQSRLSVLLILNIVASATAVVLLFRAYLTSERSLRDVKVLATDVLASINEGIVTTDREARILSINPVGTTLLGGDSRLLHRSLKDLPQDHRSLYTMCLDVVTHDSTVGTTDYTATVNGHKHVLHADCSLLCDQGQQEIGTVINIRDVTEKSLMEQRLRRMERYMGLGSLAAGLQHEIKNPLSALALHVQLLVEHLEEECPSPAVVEILDVLTAETRRVNDVLDGFRDFASINDLNRSHVDLREVIQRLARFVDPQAASKNIQVEVNVDDTVPKAIAIDAVRVEQTLLNLVLNALESMPDGGRVSIRAHFCDQAVRIEIRDTGNGIPEELQDKVFDPYFTTRSEGTGMGLAICEKIVRQHGGNIEFETGRAGTTFTVTLPVEHEESVAPEETLV